MEKKKLLIWTLVVCSILVVIFALKENSAKVNLPEWLPQNSQSEIKVLNPKDPSVKLLKSEINSVRTKYPKAPLQYIIQAVEVEINSIKNDESANATSSSYGSAPDLYELLKPFHFSDHPVITYSDGTAIHPGESKPSKARDDDPDFYKGAWGTTEAKFYDITSQVFFPDAFLWSGSQKANLENIAGIKGDPTLGFIDYTLQEEYGRQIHGMLTFPGKGAATAVKIVGNDVYFKFKDGEILAFDTTFPADGKNPSMKFVSKIP